MYMAEEVDGFDLGSTLV